MKLLDDVGVWLFFERGDRKTYIVGSITADRYLTVPAAKLPAIRAFMERLDGSRTLDQVRGELLREHGLKVDVEALHRKFDGAGLLADGSGPSRGAIERMSATLLRLPIDRLLRFLQRLSPLVPVLAGTGLAAIAAALTMFALDPVSRSLMAKAAGDQSLWKAVWLALGVMFLSGFLHEMSHACSRAVGIKHNLACPPVPGRCRIVALKLAGCTRCPQRQDGAWSAGVFANSPSWRGALLACGSFGPVRRCWKLRGDQLFMAILTSGHAGADRWLLPAGHLTKRPERADAGSGGLRWPFRPGKQRLSWFVLAYPRFRLPVWLPVVHGLHHASWISAPGYPTPGQPSSILMLAR
jgi:hypothetical protein